MQHPARPDCPIRQAPKSLEMTPFADSRETITCVVAQKIKRCSNSLHRSRKEHSYPLRTCRICACRGTSAAHTMSAQMKSPEMPQNLDCRKPRIVLFCDDCTSASRPSNGHQDQNSRAPWSDVAGRRALCHICPRQSRPWQSRGTRRSNMRLVSMTPKKQKKEAKIAMIRYQKFKRCKKDIFFNALIFFFVICLFQELYHTPFPKRAQYCSVSYEQPRYSSLFSKLAYTKVAKKFLRRFTSSIQQRVARHASACPKRRIENCRPRLHGHRHCGRAFKA